MNDKPFQPPLSNLDSERDDLPPDSQLDPVFLHAVHEGRIILAVWGVCLAWSLGICSQMAYRTPGAQVSITLGVPSWVFWGIVFPWVVVSLFSVWFSLFYMKNDDLGPNTDDQSDSDSATTGDSTGEGRHA